MEYRRRTKKHAAGRAGIYKGQRGTSGNAAGSGSTAVNILSIVLPMAAFAAVAVLLIGNFGSDRPGACYHDESPAFFACSGERKDVDAAESPMVYETDAVTAPLPSSTEAQKGSLKASLQRIDLYMLQMGVYSSYENSVEQAQAIQQKGAAGYVLDDNGNYRVIAAAYDGYEEADSVCERLEREGYECTVFNYACPGAEILITADEHSLEDINAAFEIIPRILSETSNCTLEFDSSEKDLDSVKEQLSILRADATSAKNRLLSSARSSDILFIVYSYLNDTEQLLNDYSSINGSKAEVSSALKLFYLKICMRYVTLLKEING